MNIQEMIDVLVAFRDGKKIEGKSLFKNNIFKYLVDFTQVDNPDFNFGLYEYRVKKEPKMVYLVYDEAGTRKFREKLFYSDSLIKKYVEVVDD